MEDLCEKDHLFGGWDRLSNRVAHPSEFGFSKRAAFDFAFSWPVSRPRKPFILPQLPLNAQFRPFPA